MNFINIGTLIVFALFAYFVFLFISKAILVNQNLNSLINTFGQLKKEDLIYKFQELNNYASRNPFIGMSWAKFKETLIFKSQKDIESSQDKLGFDSVVSKNASVFSIADCNYFFNEETLVHDFMNYKLISSVPGILTGIGPLGTFLYIALGFTGIDFSTQDATVNSITNLLDKIEIAATISVAAIASALIFILIERVVYHFMCRKPLLTFQHVINSLFTQVSSEKFLIDILNESKRQNNLINEHIGSLSKYIEQSFDTSIKDRIIPHLENLTSSLNNLGKPMKGDDFLGKILDK